ncbi:MAG: hypothetical protein AAB433_11790 [Nitrospirota bacterium]|mgnify:FL=1
MNNNRVLIDLGRVGNTCFVVMPFHALFEAEYERVIRPAIEEAGLTCVRGDEIYTQQAIIHDIWQSIRQARLVVAELSGRNPNVMYEIGLAHAIGKPIILLTRNQEDVPFDLKALRYLFYDTNNPEWGLNLRSELTKKVRHALDTPALAAHLPGIQVAAVLPEAPLQPLVRPAAVEPTWDLGGAWSTSWLSVRRERPHEATLVIAPEHGTEFSATMTVSYVRENIRTIAQETLTGTLRGKELSLTGVSYTFVQQGSARSYSLDSFDLTISGDGQALRGHAVLRHGKREVVFKRLGKMPV